MTANDQWIRETVERFEKSLTTYAWRMLGDLESARDVVQETFMRLCGQRRAAVDGHAAQWLFTVCRSRALDVLRHRRIARERPVATHTPSRQPGPPGVCEARETAALVAAFVEQLPPSQREVVRLKFQHGMSYQQIADITGLSVGNVGFLMHHGIKSLRARLTEPVSHAASSEHHS
ncbi:MAG: sigma-70 family RNA polymerase sigma factor [Planctomycetes bacterium]|nr:sigma-70 family RNA polymerase sigma factor [Planctomycetota bacterium]